MKTERIYTVSFERHADCRIDEIILNCWAYNAQDAKRIARETWENRNAATHGRIPHMFGLEAHRASTQVMEDLRVKDWRGQERTGWDAMWSFIMTGTRTWRVNGINKYGPKAGRPYWS